LTSPEARSYVYRESGVRADPFRDEVAIDFPSTGRFIERARATFFADSGDDQPKTLCAEVHVSSAAAYRGAVLPVDVTLPSTCHVCGGRGETWAEPCVACGGTGNSWLRCPLTVAVPPGVADGARFRFRVRSPQGSPVRVEVTVAIRNLRV
jgi:hypothetical protein